MGLRTHKRLTVLVAVVILPLSAAVATARPSNAPSPAELTGATSGLTAALDAAALLPRSSTAGVDKAEPVGWSGVNGHRAVVVGSVRQRVEQVSALSTYDIPQVALAAYQHAEASLAASQPGCHLSWTLLAGIGQVESDNGQYGGAVVLTNGDTSPHILGPVLNGTGGVGAIRDTDGGRFDGDPIWDRAVGPMQFIPGTWAAYGADGNGDGISDPNNIDDAALAAGRYLCAGGGDLRVVSQERDAVMRYNHSVSYVDLVLRLAQAYAAGSATIIPAGPDTTPPRHTAPPRQPVKPPHKQQYAGKVPGSGEGSGEGSGGGTGGQGHGGGSGGSGGSGGGGGVTPPPIHTDPAHNLPTTHSPVTKPPVQQPPVQQPPVQKPPAHKPPVHHPKPIIGVLQTCTTGWCVGTTPLDFGANADLSLKQGDYNVDGKVRSVKHELESLVGQTITLVAFDAHAKPVNPAHPATPVVPMPLPPAVPPTSTSVDPAKDAVPAVVSITVTLDADGVVASINTIAYLAELPAS